SGMSASVWCAAARMGVRRRRGDKGDREGGQFSSLASAGEVAAKPTEGARGKGASLQRAPSGPSGRLPRRRGRRRVADSGPRLPRRGVGGGDQAALPAGGREEPAGLLLARAVPGDPGGVAQGL